MQLFYKYSILHLSYLLFLLLVKKVKKIGNNLKKSITFVLKIYSIAIANYFK